MKDKRIVIKVSNLTKRFSSGPAVDGISFEVQRGVMLGLLGPNGAGKTTTMRMLCTLLSPTSGTITIAGFDLASHQEEVRRNIGYVSQKGGMETHNLTGRDNLMFQAELYGMSGAQATKRVNEVIEQLQLGAYADRDVSTYSGGQRRLFDVAAGILNTPKLLFLDEPTTGLDPQNRVHVWQVVKQLHEAGTTIVLTTHYLEEADALCNRIAIVDRGNLVALDTPAALKRKIAGDIIAISFVQPDDVQKAQELFKAESFVKEMHAQDDTLHLYVDRGDETLPVTIARLHEHHIAIKTVRLSRPTLDDVFLKLTGHSLSEPAGA